MKNLKNPIRNRTRDLPACSAVPQKSLNVMGSTRTDAFSSLDTNKAAYKTKKNINCVKKRCNVMSQTQTRVYIDLQNKRIQIYAVPKIDFIVQQNSRIFDTA
jgi:hypothetical protein